MLGSLSVLIPLSLTLHVTTEYVVKLLCRYNVRVEYVQRSYSTPCTLYRALIQTLTLKQKGFQWMALISFGLTTLISTAVRLTTVVFFFFFFPSLECFREHYRATSLHRISVLRHWWSFFLFLVFPTDRNVVQGPTGCNCLTQVCTHSFYRVYCVGWGNYIMMQRVEILFTLVSPFFFVSFLFYMLTLLRTE